MSLERAKFVLEAKKRLRREHGQELERDADIVILVDRFVDLAHTAPADQPLDPEPLGPLESPRFDARQLHPGSHPTLRRPHYISLPGQAELAQAANLHPIVVKIPLFKLPGPEGQR